MAAPTVLSKVVDSTGGRLIVTFSTSMATGASSFSMSDRTLSNGVIDETVMYWDVSPAVLPTDDLTGVLYPTTAVTSTTSDPMQLWPADTSPAGDVLNLSELVEPPTTGDETGGGIYWTFEGIKEQLGLKNVRVTSDLDNEQDPSTAVTDMARVAADGAAADAYTNLRAERGANPFPTEDLVSGNIADTYTHFELVRLATDLYASYLLVVHRIWEPVGTIEDRDRSRDDLYKRAMSLYDQLFGKIDEFYGQRERPGTFESVPLNRRNVPESFECY